MSDSDTLTFTATPTSSDSSSEEEQPRRRRKLQKRKKPTAIRRRGKTRDPFDDAALLRPSDTMEEEMNAIRQVFKRMTEKKIQQKNERKAECKRLYMEAFHGDVDHIFRKAARYRSKVMNKVSGEINAVKAQIKTSREELLEVHSTYRNNISAELVTAKKEIGELRAILADLDAQFLVAKEQVESDYAEISDAATISLQQLEVDLVDTYEDKTYLNSFRPILEQLL